MGEEMEKQIVEGEGCWESRFPKLRMFLWERQLVWRELSSLEPWKLDGGLHFASKL